MNENPIYTFLKKLTFYILAIALGSFLLWGAYSLFEILGISVNVYGNYLIYAIAMALFKFTLSENFEDSIFSNKIE